MENEFVTYEVALALKELGFDEECFGEWLNLKIGKYLRLNEEDSFWNITSLSANIKAPIKQQVFRWFREKYGISHSIYMYNNKIVANVSGNNYGSLIYEIASYEEAENACIDKLIEIAKQQVIS